MAICHLSRSSGGWVDAASHSSHRAVHLSIAGYATREVLCTSLNRRTRVSCRRGSCTARRVATIDGAIHRFGALAFPALGLILAPNNVHCTMVRSPSFSQPRMRASRVWQRRSLVHRKQIRQVAQTEFILLRQRQFPCFIIRILSARFRRRTHTPAAWNLAVYFQCWAANVTFLVYSFRGEESG